MAETYVIELGVSTDKIGSDVVDTVPLYDYGYTDEEWDALSAQEHDELISSWVEEHVWENTESWGTVNRG
jgi:hypothetical protein